MQFRGKYIVIVFVLFCVQIAYSQNRTFVNMGFEPPYTPTVATYVQTDESNLTGWKTTATDNLIEVWKSGYSGFSSYEGAQFAELNATQPSRLYQTVYLANGETLSWDYWHRGRGSATVADVMQLNIYNSTGTAKLATLQTASTTNSAWVEYSGSWVNTLSSGLYQFSFEAISTGSGSLSVGNFIDGCHINLTPLVEFSSATYSGRESIGNENLPALMINGTVPAGGSVVTFTIDGGTATQNTDYTIASITIPAGDYVTTSPISISLSVLNDVLLEGNETISLSINSCSNTMQKKDTDGDGINRTACTYTIYDQAAPGGVSAGLSLWLRSDAGVYSDIAGTTQSVEAGTVKYWKDFSSTASDAVIAGVAYPVYKASTGLLNFNQAVYFANGDNEYFNTNLNAIRSSSYSLFASQLRDNSNSNSYLLGTQSNTNGQALSFGYSTNTQSILTQRGGTPPSVAVTAYNAPQTTAILFGESNLTSGKTITEYRNSGIATTTTADVTALSGTAQAVVGRGRSTDGYEGSASEIIAYNRTLSATEKQKVISYLAIRNGVTLASTDYLASDGTKFWDATLAGIYSNDIAMIARDDIDALHQKQSKSVNSDDILTVGIGEIATSVASNANSLSINLSALAWGNNNGSIDSWGVADYGLSTNGEAIAARIARIWQIQKTSTVGSVHIKANLNSITSGQDLQYVRLLVDGDGVFTSGAQSVLPTTFDNINKTIEFDFTFTGALSYVSLGSINKLITPLPILLSKFEVFRVSNRNVQVLWEMQSTQSIVHFTVERSLDGKSFAAIGSYLSDNTAIISQKFNFLDNLISSCAAYYRLAFIDDDNTINYSKIKYVSALQGASQCMISSSSDNKMISLQVQSSAPFAQLRIIDSNGRLITVETICTNQLQTVFIGQTGLVIAQVIINNQLIDEKVVVLY